MSELSSSRPKQTKAKKYKYSVQHSLFAVLVFTMSTGLCKSPTLAIKQNDNGIVHISKDQDHSMHWQMQSVAIRLASEPSSAMSLHCNIGFVLCSIALVCGYYCCKHLQHLSDIVTKCHDMILGISLWLSWPSSSLCLLLAAFCFCYAW